MNKFLWQHLSNKTPKKTTTRLRNHSSIHDKNLKGDYQLNDIIPTINDSNDVIRILTKGVPIFGGQAPGF